MEHVLTRDALIAAIDAGSQPKYVFFWGHTRPADGIVGATCMSQWYPAPFEVDGVRYATAEHYMMAGKARVFDDRDMLGQILDSQTALSKPRTLRPRALASAGLFA